MSPSEIRYVRDMSDKNFGLQLSALFSFLAVLALVTNQEYYWILFLISLLFTVIAFANPQFVKPIKILFMKISDFMQVLTVPIFMFSVYFILFTPIALTYRKSNRIRMKIDLFEDSNARSAWRQSSETMLCEDLKSNRRWLKELFL